MRSQRDHKAAVRIAQREYPLCRTAHVEGGLEARTVDPGSVHEELVDAVTALQQKMDGVVIGTEVDLFAKPAPLRLRGADVLDVDARPAAVVEIRLGPLRVIAGVRGPILVDLRKSGTPLRDSIKRDEHKRRNRKQQGRGFTQSRPERKPGKSMRQS